MAYPNSARRKFFVDRFAEDALKDVLLHYLIYLLQQLRQKKKKSQLNALLLEDEERFQSCVYPPKLVHLSHQLPNNLYANSFKP